jgi:GGDEF domain-containing protein
VAGLPNRRAWDAELERRLAVARRSGGALVVGLIDALLSDASGAWQMQMRAEDLIARYGGEEFGVILHGRLRDAAAVMERLREVTPDGQTFSAGLALWTGKESVEQLMARLDAALYTAKREGRDQYSVTGHPARTDLQSDFLARAG